MRSRFPRAQELPNRPRLTDLLRAEKIPLAWDDRLQAYAPESLPTIGGTRMATTVSPYLGPDAPAEAHAKLLAAIERRGFVALLAPFRRLAPARRELLARLELTEVDVTGILLERLRALGFPWEAIVAADNGSPTDPDFRSLVELVQHHVVPAIEETLAAADRPVLITEAAPLARYGQMRLLQELADPTRPRPAARLLLVPARRNQALLDDVPLPLTSPASQSLWLPDTWIAPNPALR